MIPGIIRTTVTDNVISLGTSNFPQVEENSAANRGFSLPWPIVSMPGLNPTFSPGFPLASPPVISPTFPMSAQYMKFAADYFLSSSSNQGTFPRNNGLFQTIYPQLVDQGKGKLSPTGAESIKKGPLFSKPNNNKNFKSPLLPESNYRDDTSSDGSLSNENKLLDRHSRRSLSGENAYPNNLSSTPSGSCTTDIDVSLCSRLTFKNNSPLKESDFSRSYNRVLEENSLKKPILKFGVQAILSTVQPTALQGKDCNPSSSSQDHVATLSNRIHSLSDFPSYPYLNSPLIGSHFLPPLDPPILPWLPSSIRGRNRRGMLRRAVFSDTQRKTLEKTFQQQKYIGKPDRKKLATKLGLKDSQVKIWFQNRRMKWRNSKERQTLCSASTAGCNSANEHTTETFSDSTEDKCSTPSTQETTVLCSFDANRAPKNSTLL